MGLPRSYLVWLAFLIGGTVVYSIIGRNAWYFQMIARGVPAEAAKSASALRGQEIFPAGTLVDSLVLSARNRKTWALVAIYFTTFGGFIAMTAWLPVYWTSFYSVTPILAGTLAGVYSIVTSLVRVGGGYLSDRIGGETTGILALGLLLAGAILMTLSRGLPPLGRRRDPHGRRDGDGQRGRLPSWSPRRSPRRWAAPPGWVGGLGAFGGFAIPPLMGTIVQVQGTEGYANGFVIFACLAGMAPFFSSGSSSGIAPGPCRPRKCGKMRKHVIP